MPKLSFPDQDKSYEVPDGASFLEVCQEHGAPHPFGCTVGSCGTCRLVILEGGEHVDPPDEDERDTVEMCTSVEGARLGCQLVIRGDISVRPVD
jgi:adenylate cyclase